ncbi:MAG: sugar transferase [Chlorobi bacterium]|nr:sugar transferase [Chlorobiota bacterium]
MRDFLLDVQNKISNNPTLIKDKNPFYYHQESRSKEQEVCKVIPSVEIIRKFVPDNKKSQSFEHEIIRGSSFAVLKYILSHLDLKRINKILLTSTHELNAKNILNSVKYLAKINNIRAIVNLNQVNYSRFINKYFESINKILPDTGIYIGCVETVRQRNKHLFYRYKRRFIASLIIFFEFLFHRVFPKINFLKGLYFGITKGKYRFLTIAETLGRLISCGFEIIEYKQIRNLVYFVVIKTREPYYDTNPSYGPVVKIKKTDKDGKVYYRYKFRLHHPYSEYIPDHVLMLNATSRPSSTSGDLRYTFLGKTIYEIFLPSIGNYFRRITLKLNSIYERVPKVRIFPKYTIEDFFYIKRSLGKGGKSIKIYKFRTMVKNADQLDHMLTEFNSYGNPVNDTRVTSFGKFMRKVWIDELPQIYSLIKGDIKLVGIRPMRECDWQRYPTGLKEEALKQKPGLMGIQYGSPYRDNYDDHLSYFQEYIEQWKKYPLKTDIHYFIRIWYNIIFKGVRST